jgi:hypothetical protein
VAKNKANKANGIIQPLIKDWKRMTKRPKRLIKNLLFIQLRKLKRFEFKKKKARKSFRSSKQKGIWAKEKLSCKSTAIIPSFMGFLRFWRPKKQCKRLHLLMIFFCHLLTFLLLLKYWIHLLEEMLEWQKGFFIRFSGGEIMSLKHYYDDVNELTPLPPFFTIKISIQKMKPFNFTLKKTLSPLSISTENKKAAKDGGFFELSWQKLITSGVNE